MKLISKKATIGALLLTSILSACNQNVGRPPEVAFDQMTPAQHLEQARSIMKSDTSQLSVDQMKETNRQLSAIPQSAHESAEAILLEKQLIKAEQVKYLQLARRRYTSDLERSLRDKGFDIVVTDLGDRLIVTSNLLKGDSGRVQFLASIRKAKDSQGLCAMGFRRIALGGSGIFTEDHTYQLGCKSAKK